MIEKQWFSTLHVEQKFDLPNLERLLAPELIDSSLSWSSLISDWETYGKFFNDDLGLNIFCSILKDALDSEWELNENVISKKMDPNPTKRKQKQQEILNARIDELQSKEPLRSVLSKLKDKSNDWVSHPLDFSSSEEVLDYLSNVYLDEVVEDDDTEAMDIYKYFRNSWRIPNNSIPGRTISFLVRSTKDHKVIAILSLASPVFWMANRDEALGLESFQKKKSTEKKKIPGMRKLSASISDRKSKDDWIKRWRKNGLIDEGELRHHMEDKFTVDELNRALKDALLHRLEQFPLKLILNKTNLKKVQEWGVKVKETNPTIWAKEPQDTKLDKKNYDKRRNITKKCITAYEDLIKIKNKLSIEEFYDLIHNGKSKTLLKSLQYARKERMTRIVSGNIGEMVVCGSVPPWNQFRVGKLSSLLSFSNEISESWKKKYNNSESKISSNLAGRKIERDNTLFAISTTGLYGTINRQYKGAKMHYQNRTLGFEFFGTTGEGTNEQKRGPSTLTISDRSWNLISRYSKEVELEQVSGKFGEGTSARIRRLQSCIRHISNELKEKYKCEVLDMKLLNEIILNPFSRSVHVGLIPLKGKRVLLGIEDFNSKTDILPSVNQIVQYWREKWLLPYLASDEVISKFHAIDPYTLLPPKTLEK